MDDTDGSTLYAGGSHGGSGGADTGSTINQCYGNTYFPSDPGSGGGAHTGSSSYQGGSGGGIIKLTVGGTLTLDGTIMTGSVLPTQQIPAPLLAVRLPSSRMELASFPFQVMLVNPEEKLSLIFITGFSPGF